MRTIAAFLAIAIALVVLALPAISGRADADAEWLDRKIAHDSQFTPRYIPNP